MAKLTKTQTLAAVAEKTGMSKKDVGEFMDKLIELAYHQVKSSGEFTLPSVTP